MENEEGIEIDYKGNKNGREIIIKNIVHKKEMSFFSIAEASRWFYQNNFTNKEKTAM